MENKPQVKGITFINFDSKLGKITILNTCVF
jgi:hypothetical protein